MTYDDAKRLLRLSRTRQQRQQAIREALQLGMPLWEIERYLDWWENVQRDSASRPERPPSDNGHASGSP